MSATMNTVSSILYEDYIRPFKIIKHSDSTANFIMKCSVVFITIVCIVLGRLVELFPNIIQITMTIISVSNGIVLGVFCLGMLWPWANKYGATVGILTSTVVMCWMAFEAQSIILSGELMYVPLPTLIDGCDRKNLTSIFISNSSQIVSEVLEKPFSIFRVSFVWYTLIGSSIVFIIGVIVSWTTGHQEIRQLEPKLLSPVVHYLLPKISSNLIYYEQSDKCDISSML